MADLVALVRSLGLSPHLYALQTTHKYMAPACRHTSTRFCRLSPNVSTLSPTGCNPNVCSLTTTRRSSCGVQRSVTNIVYRSLVPLFGSFTVTPSSTFRDFGVYIDADLSMQSHVRRTVSRCFAALRQLCSIRRQIPSAVFQSLIVAMVLSGLNYCNSVLCGLPASLQSVQNAAAWLIFGIRWSEHITDALISLHWLRVPGRISFKLAVLAYRAIHGTEPTHKQSLRGGLGGGGLSPPNVGAPAL